MYQRSSVRGRIAEEAASTDSLTSLKNRRAFEVETESALMTARAESTKLALCLIDIDRFKQVNDRHGHAMGDAVLQVLAGAIEQTVPGNGFRLGGDEFVLFVPTRNYAEVVAGIQTRFARGQTSLSTLGETVTVSVGVAIYPDHADELHMLQKRADLALYRSKYGGRACITLYDAEDSAVPFTSSVSASSVPEASTPTGVVRALTDSRLLTAQRIVSLIDAVSDAAARERGILAPSEFADVLDRWTGVDSNHSQAVASLTCSLARIVGVTGEELEQLYIAALLHDVGKIVLPDSVLSKAGALDDEERKLIERHPVIGYELLADLGSPQAATFVLHHHERWDGDGYPHGLAGAEIPFGSRLILVADAFDALTSDRSYRKAVSVEAAMHEIQCESGRQFDPLVVSALHEHFANPAPAPPTAVLEPGGAWSSSM
jgi:diguanylate cyclase (GGDEF)-like protein